MKHLFGKSAFRVAQADYPWEDVLLAAHLWGEWPGIVDRARTGLSLLSRAEADADVASAVDALATEFRYERNLLTAEEMEAWLARWGLAFETWATWIAASLLRSRAVGPPPEPEDGFDAEELEKAVHAEALCSKDLNRFLTKLAGRAAVFASLGESAEALTDGDRRELIAMFPEPVRTEGMAGLDPGRAQERMAVVAALERAFRRFEESAVTPVALAASVRSNKARWTRIKYRRLTLANEDVAREALLGVREDGETLDDVAADARAEVESGSCFADVFEPAFRDRLLAAQKGDILGPLPHGEGQALVLVAEKVLPSDTDEVLMGLVREDLLERLVARERDNRVFWPGLR